MGCTSERPEVFSHGQISPIFLRPNDRNSHSEILGSPGRMTTTVACCQVVFRVSNCFRLNIASNSGIRDQFRRVKRLVKSRKWQLDSRRSNLHNFYSFQPNELILVSLESYQFCLSNKTTKTLPSILLWKLLHLPDCFLNRSVVYALKDHNFHHKVFDV